MSELRTVKPWLITEPCMIGAISRYYAECLTKRDFPDKHKRKAFAMLCALSLIELWKEYPITSEENLEVLELVNKHRFIRGAVEIRGDVFVKFRQVWQPILPQ